MFKELSNFSYKRTKKEAFGFYLAYLLAIFLFGAVAGGVVGLLSGKTDFNEGLRYGTFIAVILVFVLSLAIIKAKKIWQFGYVLLALLSALLALVGGGLLGLIPVAFLTMRESGEKVSRI